jgi:segregation and condensation protein A
MKIDIGIYYGPIDLLVYLVRKKELDIFDIPITQIAEEYLDFIRNISRDDLEDAADFLLMAAILIRFKVKSLLPRTPEDEEAASVITLMQIVGEFQKYKEIAKQFGIMETESSKQYPRIAKTEPPLLEGDITTLILAFRRLKPPEEKQLYIKRPEVPIGEIIADLKGMLEAGGKVNFMDVLKTRTDMPLAVGYFFGMLEIVTEGYALVEQEGTFGEIFLSKKVLQPAL